MSIFTAYGKANYLQVLMQLRARYVNAKITLNYKPRSILDIDSNEA